MNGLELWGCSYGERGAGRYRSWRASNCGDAPARGQEAWGRRGRGWEAGRGGRGGVEGWAVKARATPGNPASYK